jgi:carboxylesterase type B
MPFIFGNPGRHTFTATEERLALLMMGYWSTFAKIQSPNDPSLPVWPQYNATGDWNIFLELPPKIGRSLEEAACNFWDVHYQKYYFQ